MTFDAARMLDTGDEARVQISLIKFWGAHAPQRDRSRDPGPRRHGVTSDTPLEQMDCEARYARIYDGPDEVHRMVVARRLIQDPVNNAPWA